MKKTYISAKLEMIETVKDVIMTSGEKVLSFDNTTVGENGGTIYYGQIFN